MGVIEPPASVAVLAVQITGAQVDIATRTVRLVGRAPLALGDTVAVVPIAFLKAIVASVIDAEAQQELAGLPPARLVGL